MVINAKPLCAFQLFSLTREGENPSQFLEDFEGYLQADAFSGYDQVYAKGKVIEVACGDRLANRTHFGR